MQLTHVRVCSDRILKLSCTLLQFESKSICRLVQQGCSTSWQCLKCSYLKSIVVAVLQPSELWLCWHQVVSPRVLLYCRYLEDTILLVGCLPFLSYAHKYSLKGRYSFSPFVVLGSTWNLCCMGTLPLLLGWKWMEGCFLKTSAACKAFGKRAVISCSKHWCNTD